MRRLALICGAALAAASDARAESLRCHATRDVWLSACDKETSFNGGKTTRIKLKAWQEFGIVDFDVSALRGRTARKAWICVKPAGGHTLGLNNGTDLRWLTVSTVSHDWVEGDSQRMEPDPTGHGATFLESSGGRRDWGWPGARVWDVILGNGNTLRSDGVLEPAGDRLRMELDPRLVHALAAGASHGLLLMDGSVSLAANCYIGSRESGEGPYLDVETGEPDTAPPAAPGSLRASPSPGLAGTTAGAIELALAAPPGAFAYRVRLNGADVARWQIPFAAGTGATHAFPILDLEPGARIVAEVSAVDAAGNEGPRVKAETTASPAVQVPSLPACPFRPRPGDPPALGKARVWAFPEITKISPRTGEVLHESADGDPRRCSAVWDGASRTVRLAAARGEIASFQVALEGEARDAAVQVSDLEGPGTIRRDAVRMWRNWYVGEESEYALPLAGPLHCPMPDNGIEGQRMQAVTVDIPVPASAAAGEYHGAVTVSAGDAATSLALRVTVYDAVLPDDIHFNPELNAYSGPGEAGSPRFIRSFRLAHYHRCAINRVPYSQRGRIHQDWAPDVDASGRVTDWSRFDANLGGALDGSWFRDNPRPGVPVAVLYLPLCEAWPLDFKSHYRPGPGVPVNVTEPRDRLRHDTLAAPIERAMDQAFADAWVRCAGDFARHAAAKGWNRTLFEGYLNNKRDYGYTLWLLDEPYVYVDWAALNFFARLFRRAVADPEVYTPEWHRRLFETGLGGMNRPRATFLWRADVSRPMWQGNVSDGLFTMVTVNGDAFGMPRLIRNARERMPATFRVYGSANEVGRCNWESAAWCLRAYALGMDGVTPWQSLGNAEALAKPDTNGLIVDAGGRGDAIASFRVHALRRGAQDAELLRLLQLKRGWSREQVGALVAQRIPLAAAARKREGEETAATPPAASLSARAFCELKEGVLQLLAR